MTFFRSLLLLVLSSAPALAATYTIDAGHSRVGFSVSHMTISTVRGEFGTFSGTVEYDGKNIGATKVSGTVTVGSVDTRDVKRDEHLKSADFFDSVSFPEMKFVSRSVKNITATDFDLVGDLSIRGVTKEVTFKVKVFPADVTDPWGNVKTGTTATTTINRKDFGVNWSKTLDSGGLMVGDEVAIELNLELLKSK